MKLYHGSNIEINIPDLSKSKPYKDFGKGFYLSPNYEQAIALANQKVEQLKSGEPYVSIFEFDNQVLTNGDLNVKVFEDYSEEWANFIFDNRNRSNISSIHTYDIVIGPIADDGVTFQLRRFSSGIITMDKLVDELKYAKGLTIQYYFGTSKALSHLNRI